MSNTTFTRKNNWQCKKYYKNVTVGTGRQNLDSVSFNNVDEDI